MKRIGVFVVLLLLMGCSTMSAVQTPVEEFPGGWAEKAMFEARERHAGVIDNCLLVARDVQATLRAESISTTLLVVDLNERKFHAVVCTEEAKCLDNGHMSPGLFDAEELEHYQVVFSIPRTTHLASR